MEGAIGRGADVLICNDPIKPADAESQRLRDRCYDRFRDSLMPRLNNPANDPVVLVMQRLHTHDLCGRLIKQQPELWRRLSLSAIAEVDEEIRIGEGDSNVYRRHHG
jgi:hypothetical protein